MLVTIAFLINIYLFPTGRRLFALEQVRKRAKTMGYARIAQHAALAIDHDRRTQRMEMRSRAAPSAVFGPEAQELDSELDQSVMGLHIFLDSQIRLYGASSQRGLAAGTIRQELFPDGPNAIIKLPYVQENQAVHGMLARLEDPDMAEAVAALPELGEAIDHIRALNARFGRVLAEAQNGTAPSAEDVRQARTRGQTLLSETVALIIAEFAGTEKDPRRDELLEPILVQNQAIRQIRRRRRNPTDIDPDTGVIIPDSADPAQDGLPDSDIDDIDDSETGELVA